MIEVLNDFGLLKRIYVFSSMRDPVGTGYQSGTGTGASLIIWYHVNSYVLMDNRADQIIGRQAFMRKASF